MRTFCFVLVVGAGLLRTNASEELIRNGGFETGDLSGWETPQNNPNPWYISTAKAASGTYSSYNPVLGYAVAAVTLYQRFYPAPVTNITSAGYWYFHQSEATYSTVGLAAQLLFSDGTGVADTLMADNPAYQRGVWAYRDLLPTLLSYPDKALIQIGFFPKSTEYQYLDDVSIIGIQIVPEPASSLVFFTGMFFLPLMATRLKKGAAHFALRNVR